MVQECATRDARDGCIYFLTTSLTKLARAAVGVSAQGCERVKVASCQAPTLQEEYLALCVKEKGFAHKSGKTALVMYAHYSVKRKIIFPENAAAAAAQL